MHRLWRKAHGAFGKVLVGDDQVDILRQAIDGAVGHRNMVQTSILHLFAQYACTKGARAHSGIAGYDNFTHVVQIFRQIQRRLRDFARRFAAGFRLLFQALHTAGGFRQAVALFITHANAFKQHRGREERDQR